MQHVRDEGVTALMTATEMAAPVRTRVLPTGTTGSLWTTRPACGVVEFRGRPLRIEVPDPRDVLFPTDCGLSLIDTLQRHDLPIAGSTALDIGAGSGVYTVALLLAGAAHVTALDVNPAFAPVATANVLNNGLELSRVCCATAGLADFRPTRRFDLVVTNPPHFPYDTSYAGQGGMETALVAGRDGRALYDVVVQRADELLAPGGTLLFAHSSLADVPRTVDEMAARGFTGRTLDVCEMDIPLVTYAEHRATLLGRLEQLRREGRATFAGTRFTVHALAFRRTGEGELPGGDPAAVRHSTAFQEGDHS
jgi:predicted RNA methylase